MSNEKISSLELIAELSQHSGITKKTATAFMRQFMTTIEEALLREGVVKIKGFGTFKVTWNESRSSVNVQTGERYEIAGHNKITFTPDDEMRDKVNEPFAHLSPVDLEGNTIEKGIGIPEEDPHLKRLAEQATEIMSIISDLQGLTPRKAKKPEQKNEASTEEVVEKIAETSEDPVVATIVEQPVETVEDPEPQKETIVSPEQTQSDNIIQPVEDAKITVQEPTAPLRPVTETSQGNIDAVIPDESSISEDELAARMAVQPAKKSKKWLYISILIVVLLACVAVACYLFFPFWETKTQPAPPIIEQKAPIAQVQTVAPPDTAQQPIATPAPKPEPPKDVFAKPREYKEFIATETMEDGTTLTILALKYYGHKVFWVYIYEANKAKIPNPAVIRPGTKVAIPKLDPALINKHNARCFQEASRLQTLYTK